VNYIVHRYEAKEKYLHAVGHNCMDCGLVFSRFLRAGTTEQLPVEVKFDEWVSREALPKIVAGTFGAPSDTYKMCVGYGGQSTTRHVAAVVVTCSRCNESNSFAIPNQPDGSFKCYGCRQPGVY
jgi:hypothetical protein